MYSGLLPRGLSEADLSPDNEGEEENTQEETQNTRTANETERSPAESDQNVQNESSSSSSSSSFESCLPGVSHHLYHVCTHLYNSHHIYIHSTMFTFNSA